MAPKLAAMDTWWPHATVGIGLAVPGRPIGLWSWRTGAPEASATGRDRTPTGPRWVRMRSGTPSSRLGPNPNPAHALLTRPGDAGRNHAGQLPV
jgi:hypothetical protein